MKALADYFDNAEKAWNASEIELIGAGIHGSVAKQFLHFREEFPLDEAVKRVQRAGLSLITPEDARYPKELKTIFDPPQLLYVQGSLPPANSAYLAIVGSRQCSEYGKRSATRFAQAVARARIVVVSGLAYGIDSYAHHATLETGTPTVAVIASGHDKLTGRARVLAQHIIAKGGALISEFPPQTPALPYHHPIRNRIISGMSRATLVVEASLPSGSLITAKSAIDQNRDVLAVPGSIESPLSAGTNQLIKEGALPITTEDDLLAYFNVQPSPEAPSPTTSSRIAPTSVTRVSAPSKPRPQSNPHISKDGSAILHLLSRQPIHIDEITRKTGLNTIIVARELSQLELDGFTKQIGGMYYVLS